LTIPTSHLIAFSLASLAIIVVPGPSVLFTLARGIAWGRLVAVLTALGNGLGILMLSALVAVGLGPLLAHSKLFTTVVEVAGGLYLLWLGADALRHRHAHAASLTNREATKPPVSQVVRQGFVVGGFNPKALIFFVAVFPHFVDRSSGNVTAQLLVLGIIFAVLAVLSDGTWGMIAGTAREWLAGSSGRLVTLRTVGGVVMLGLGALIITSAFSF
jgi:threonine/homoserine/homoserine lactone efflux protein